jgi:hypothetical protein
MKTDLDTKESEGKALTELFAPIARNKKGEFARRHNIPGGPSMIAQHQSGNRPISLDAAVAYAKAFNVPIDHISKRIANEIREAAKLLEPEKDGACEPIATYPVARERPLHPDELTAMQLDKVLDMLSACPERAELLRVLPLFVDTKSKHYRGRLHEILLTPNGINQKAA